MSGGVLELVTFLVADELLALELDVVEEVERTTPSEPDDLPVLDARTLLGLPGSTPRRSRVLRIRCGDAAVGLRVDAVLEVLRVAEADLLPPPPYLRGLSAAGVRGLVEVQGRLAVVLSPSVLEPAVPSGVPGSSGPEARP